MKLIACLTNALGVQQFRPVTVERPKVLLPLVNVPMIDYTLEWLAAGGIQQVSQCHLALVLHTVDIPACICPLHPGLQY